LTNIAHISRSCSKIFIFKVCQHLSEVLCSFLPGIFSIPTFALELVEYLLEQRRVAEEHFLRLKNLRLL